MKLNYDVLGNHIRLIDIRNKNNITNRVLGINIDKFFMPSVANVIGTDLSKYKLIQNGQFACNPMHVGRDERLPVSLYTEETPAIVSPAYFMFEIIDTNILNSEYLMMWFSRSEFDRICWLKTDSSVRGGITWDDICRIEVPIPSMCKQIEIVNRYKAITYRITLKKQINDNLAEQAINWINRLFETNNNALTKTTIGNLVDSGLLATPMDGNHGEIHPKTSDYVTQGVPFIMANNLVSGYVDYNNCAFITEKQAASLRKGFAHPGDVLLTHKATIGRTAIVMEEYPTTILTPQVTYYRVQDYLYNGFMRYYFETSKFQDTLTAWSGAGSTRAYIGITKQLELPFVLPNKQLMKSIKEFIQPIEQVRYSNYKEISQLQLILSVILSRLSSY